MNPFVVAPQAGYGRTALSVNVNKVALLRNTRHLGVPSVVHAATLCLQAGADGITVHPRPDERHIRPHDVFELATLLQQWPQADYNIEGNPLQNLMGLLRDLAARGQAPQQCTFVPDAEGQATSDHGWDLRLEADRLRPLIAECQQMGLRVSLFMDPDPAAMALAKSVGADRVELYTEPYAAACIGRDLAAVDTQIKRFAAAAAAAQALGLGVNAGHDLNRDNLTPFLRGVPGVLEVSIGHALVADALELGLPATVQAYLRCVHAVHTEQATA
jgi:pyridoxine 5-phosphate synthase